MSVPDQTLIRLGRSLAATSVVFAIAGLAALAILGRADFLFGVYAVHNGLLGVGLGALAWVAIPSQPRNGAVWALAWSSFFGGLFASSAAAFVLLARGSIEGFSLSSMDGLSPSELPLRASIAVLGMGSWIPAFGLVITVGLLLFPDGRPPTPRWKWVGWYSMAAISVAILGSAWLFNPRSTEVIDTYESSLGKFVEIAVYLATIGGLVSIASLVVRYRHSSGVTRLQIRWIAWGGGSLLAALVISTFLQGGIDASGDSLPAVAVLVGEALLIFSFWVTITKYRLYEIDVVISKTLTYGSLASGHRCAVCGSGLRACLRLW